MREVGRRVGAALDLRQGNPHGQPSAALGTTGATADHGTDSTPSRSRRRGGSTGRPSAAQHVQHRPPAHPRAEHPVARGAGPCAVGRGQQGVDRLAGDVVVDQHLGQPLGQIRRASIANGSHASVRLTGPSASSSTQQQRLPSSSQVPSTISPPGASRVPHLRPRVGHRLDVVLAQHVERAHQNRSAARPIRSRRAPNSTPALAAARATRTRSGWISSPTTRTSGRTARSRAASSRVVTAARRSRGRRPADRRPTSSAARTRGECTSQRSLRRSRL